MVVSPVISLDIQVQDITNGHANWQFRQASKDQWYPANVPSTVHMDLMTNGLLDDPYYRDNLMKAYWIEVEDWEYKTQFKVSQDILNKQVVEMVFEGLDTHATVNLNGQDILKANNMHRTWVIDVKNVLSKDAINNITIHFNSAPLHDLQAADDLNKSMGIVLPFNYSFSRKASYQYGWDWGPRLVTYGVWKPIKIRAFDEVIIEGSLFRNLGVNNKSTTASIFGNVYLRLASTNNFLLQIIDQQTSNAVFTRAFNQSVIDNKQIALNFQFIVDNPKLWWTHNIGTPYLYKYLVQVVDNKGNIVDQQRYKIGIRTISWKQTPDSIGNGTMFGLYLNGISVFMKGGNYIPPDMFMPRAFKNQQVYNKTIQDAVDANFNMLRVWGGGQYEFDVFYDICDEQGILIWHDMMFACALYPGDQDYLQNVEQETTDNVRRLRNHPSIAIWNGNNEVLIGWKEWGWQDNLTDPQKTMVYQWYTDLFEGTIPRVLLNEDPDRFYWPTSPTSSQTAGFNSGDIHEWLVWASQEDIEVYNTHVGRFVSEYGMQGMIPMSSLKKFTLPTDLDQSSFVMQIHERHVKGWPNLNLYMGNYFKPTKDFESFVYGTMVMQAYAVVTGIEAHRRSQPYCMGSLYWQINDVWPVFSWASVDFYGQWKALHYRAKKSYLDFTLQIVVYDTQNYQVSVVNDYMMDKVGDLFVEIWNFDGKKLGTTTKYGIKILANNRQSYQLSIISAGNNPNSTYALAYFVQKETKQILAYNTQIFVRPIGIILPMM
eukprot:403363013